MTISSPTPSLLVDSAELSWHGRYSLDEWERRIYHEVTIPAKRTSYPKAIKNRKMHKISVLKVFAFLKLMAIWWYPMPINLRIFTTPKCKKRCSFYKVN